MRSVFVFIILIYLFSGLLLYGQSTLSGDCEGSIPLPFGVYDMPVYTSSAQNDSLEINQLISCISGGELHGYWFEVIILDSGVLSFNVIPYIAATDYDWALYNITNATCYDIRSVDTLEVRCNYSNSVNNMAITGANGGPNNQDEPTLPVIAGEVFKLYVHKWDISDNGGFRLNFGASTCTLDQSVGINENNISEKIKIGPNPSNGLINLNVDEGLLKEITAIQIMNLTGEIVVDQSIGFKGLMLYNLSNQVPGIYFMQIFTLNQQHSFKLIIQ